MHDPGKPTLTIKLLQMSCSRSATRTQQPMDMAAAAGTDLLRLMPKDDQMLPGGTVTGANLQI